MNGVTEHDPAGCPVCRLLKGMEGKALKYYHLQLTGSFDGKLTVSIPVDAKYEGATLTVLYCVDGRLVVKEAKVKNGMAIFSSEVLTYFQLLDGKYTVYTYGPGKCSIVGDTEQPMAPGRFTDVRPDHWFYSSVAYVSFLKYMVGISQTQFGPQETMTRNMMAAILYRLEGSPAVGWKQIFGDVANGLWYSQAVIWAEENGVVSGYADGSFGPNDNVTREQFIAMLYRYAKLKGYDVSARADFGTFADGSKLSDYAREAMSWAVATGLVAGRYAGENSLYLAAEDTATRAEIAALIQRFTEAYGPKVLIVNEDLLLTE